MDELELEFELHPQLAGRLYLFWVISRSVGLLLLNDANYPWFILVPRRAGATEIYHLSDEDQCAAD